MWPQGWRPWGVPEPSQSHTNRYCYRFNSYCWNSSSSLSYSRTQDLSNPVFLCAPSPLSSGDSPPSPPWSTPGWQSNPGGQGGQILPRGRGLEGAGVPRLVLELRYFCPRTFWSSADHPFSPLLQTELMVLLQVTPQQLLVLFIHWSSSGVPGSASEPLTPHLCS